MPSKKGYIPRTDGEFDTFFENLSRYVEKHRSVWGHISAEELAELMAAFQEWTEAYTPTKTPHTPVATRTKNRVKKASEKFIRDFVNRFLRYAPVTDEDRDSMGIPNRKTTRSPVGVPKELVEFWFRITSIRRVAVHFRVAGSSDKARPAGYEGEQLVWGVLDKPPERPEDLPKHTLATRTPHILNFDETERGKTVYAALCWQNETAKLGPWSMMQSTIIP